MTDTITYAPTNTVAATGAPAAGTRWQWQRRTVGSIFSSQETFETWPEAEEAAQQIAALTFADYTLSGRELNRRRTLAKLLNADKVAQDVGLQWLRDFTPVEDVIGGQEFAPVPASLYNDVDGFETWQIDGRW